MHHVRNHLLLFLLNLLPLNVIGYLLILLLGDAVSNQSRLTFLRPQMCLFSGFFSRLSSSSFGLIFDHLTPDLFAALLVTSGLCMW